MPRKRNKENKGFPTGWRWSDGAIRYIVPKGQEHHWDGKRQFTLGKTVPEAYRVFYGRIASVEGTIVRFNELFDRYLYEVTPNKSQRYQKEEQKIVHRLRSLIGDNPVTTFRPKNAYQLRDYLKAQAVKGSGEKQANRQMAVLKHTFTKAIEWGVVDVHPMHEGSFKMFPEERSEMRIPTLEEVLKALEVAPPMIQSYVRLKLLTGLRQTDLLGLAVQDVKDGYLEVMVSKTKKKTAQVLRFEMTEELEQVVKECRERPPLSKYLFKTKKGACYLKEDKTAEGFASAWTRWQAKFPKGERFTERSIRNLVGSMGDLQSASERLGHASSATTKKFYRSKVSTVTPISCISEKKGG